MVLAMKARNLNIRIDERTRERIAELVKHYEDGSTPLNASQVVRTAIAEQHARLCGKTSSQPEEAGDGA